VKNFILTLGDAGNELRGVISFDDLTNILGKIDTENVHWTSSARTEIACKYIPSDLSDSFKNAIFAVHRSLLRRCDELRQQVGKRIQLHYIDLLSEGDWYHIVIGYVEREGIDKKTALGMFRELDDETLPVSAKRKLESLEHFIQHNWVENNE